LLSFFSTKKAETHTTTFINKNIQRSTSILASKLFLLEKKGLFYFFETIIYFSGK